MSLFVDVFLSFVHPCFVTLGFNCIFPFIAVDEIGCQIFNVFYIYKNIHTELFLCP